MKPHLPLLLVLAAVLSACGPAPASGPAPEPAKPQQAAPAPAAEPAKPAAQLATPPKPVDMAGYRATDQAKKVQALALYNGPDRTQKLLEGVKAGNESKVTMYTSLTASQIEIVKPAFEKYMQDQHGLKIELSIWRGNGENVTQKVTTEAQANRHEVDLIESDSVELEKVGRGGVSIPFWSPAFSNLPEGARSSKWLWHGARINYFVMAYNTKLVKPEEVPKTWNDLLKPNLKGRISVEAGDVDWFSALVNGPLGGREKGLAFFQQLKQEQGLQNRKGHTLLTELVSAGEVPMALTVYSHEAERQRKGGAPIEWFTVDPVPGRPNGIALAANSKNPHLALMYIDWYLGKPGQDTLQKSGSVPIDPNVVTDPPRLTKGFQPLYINPEWLVDNLNEWHKLWDQTVIKGQ